MLNYVYFFAPNTYCTCSCTVGKTQVPFRMATGNVARVISQTLAQGNSKNEIRYKETDEEGKKRGVSMEISNAGTKEIPTKNTLIINIILYYFKRYGKSTMKFK